jgi:hypothetical protein
MGLDETECLAFPDCYRLGQFAILSPSMIRKVDTALVGTSILCLVLSEMRGESVEGQDMRSLQRVVFPRHCIA